MSSTRKTPERAAYGLLPMEGADAEAAADEAAADEAAEAAEAAEEVAAAAAAAVAVFGLDLSASVNRDASLKNFWRPTCASSDPGIASDDGDGDPYLVGWSWGRPRELQASDRFEMSLRIRNVGPSARVARTAGKVCVARAAVPHFQ
jgi:hypothetical protein